MSGWLEKRQAQALSLHAGDMKFYRWTRKVLWPVFRVLFSPQITGRENIPVDGSALIAANHRSFWDSAFQAFATERPIRWMGKSELFRNPFLGRIFVQLGAFPVQRGQADRGAIMVAQELLQRGEVVAIFPEGTRVREGLGEPKRGAARLANETGSPTIPMSIAGTERGELRRALWRRGSGVHLVVHPSVEPVILEEPEDSHEAATKLMSKQVWPAVQKGIKGIEHKKKIGAGVGALAIGGAAWWIRSRRR